jgi:hypothetical protein
MALLVRNPVVIFGVLAAALGTLAVFTFAKPEYHSRNESKMIDLSKVEYYSPARVRASFAANGVDLRSRNDFSGIQQLSNAPSGEASALLVAIGPRSGTVSWGPKFQTYDERFGNVLVSYGGTNEQLMRRVEAAVSDLR